MCFIHRALVPRCAACAVPKKSPFIKSVQDGFRALRLAEGVDHGPLNRWRRAAEGCPPGFLGFGRRPHRAGLIAVVVVAVAGGVQPGREARLLHLAVLQLESFVAR